MFNAERLLGQMMGGALGFGERRSRNASHAAIGLGLLGVAVAAYEHFNQQKDTAPGVPPAGSHVAPPPPAAPNATATFAPPPPTFSSANADADAELMLRAMISVANADGRIDDAERSSIVRKAHEAEMDEDDIEALDDELAAPMSVDAIAAATRPAMADRVYLASRLATDLDHRAEQQHMDRLADLLGLSTERRAALDSQIAGATVV